MSEPSGDGAWVGRTLRGKWRIDAVLGRGGMAVVFAATHRNGMRGAIKLLHDALGESADAKRRFIREGRAANTIDHPGVVKILDDDVTDDGRPFLVMELLEGETWKSRWLEGRRALPLVETVDVAIEVLAILGAAHQAGVIHRDVKPDNVFLVEGGGVKLLDFGIARLREGIAEVTQDGATMGTPAFMSPEQALAHWDDVDARSDVFAVGACMWTQLTGKLIHPARTTPELLVATATKPAPSFATVYPDGPIELVRVVDKALAFKPADRWQDAGSMRDALCAIRPRLAAKQIKTMPLAAVPLIKPSSPPAAATAPSDPGVGHTVPLHPTPAELVAPRAGLDHASAAPTLSATDTADATRIASVRNATAAPARSSRARAIAVAIAAGAAAIAGWALLRLPHDGATTPSDATPDRSATAITDAPAPTPGCGAHGAACCPAPSPCREGTDSCVAGTCSAKVRDLFAGLDHTCAVTRDGRVLCWGAGAPLTGPAPARKGAPTLLLGLTNPTTIVFGAAVAFAIVDSHVVGWGNSDSGLLGSGAPKQGFVDVANAVDMHMDGALDVAVGSVHADAPACAVVGPDIRCWGRAAGGVRPKTAGSAPARIDLDAILAGVPRPPFPMPPRRVGIGASDFACALLRGDLFHGFTCWGTTKPAMTLWRETSEVGFTYEDMSDVSAFGVGRGGACAATGRFVKCWGAAGTCDKPKPDNTVQPAMLPEAVTDLAIGGSHQCAIAGQKLYCWGTFAPSTGSATTGDAACLPHVVPLPDAPLRVVVGAAHTCALTGGGAVYCFGKNDEGQVGCTDAPVTSAPCRVSL